MTDATGEAGRAELPAWLQSLNEARQKAVLYGTSEDGGSLDPPLLVIAGAGSGKTNTLAHRVAHLVARGADPCRILLLTFTGRAADETCRRVARILAIRTLLAPHDSQAGRCTPIGRLVDHWCVRWSTNPVSGISAGRCGSQLRPTAIVL